MSERAHFFPEVRNNLFISRFSDSFLLPAPSRGQHIAVLLVYGSHVCYFAMLTILTEFCQRTVIASILLLELLIPLIGARSPLTLNSMRPV